MYKKIIGVFIGMLIPHLSHADFIAIYATEIDGNGYSDKYGEIVAPSKQALDRKIGKFKRGRNYYDQNYTFRTIVRCSSNGWAANADTYSTGHSSYGWACGYKSRKAALAAAVKKLHS